MTTFPLVTLANGRMMPAIGLGCFLLDKKLLPQIAYNAIVKYGYRHLDCASIYNNEQETGNGLKNAMKDAKIERKDLFITSKLWNTCHSKPLVRKACLQTLSDLQLDYLDLYLVHWPIPLEHPEKTGKGNFPKDSHGQSILAKIPLQETWEAMEDLVAEGLVRSIGVSNYIVAHLLDMLSYAKIMPVANQIELHPYYTRENLVEFCKKLNIALIAYSPLARAGMGLLQDDTVKLVADKYGKTPAQVLLRWGIEKGFTVIPRSVHEERYKENMDIFDFKFSKEEIESLDKLNRNLSCTDIRGYFNLPLFAA